MSITKNTPRSSETNENNYIVVVGDEDYLTTFTTEVNERLEEGFVPVGGIAVRTGGAGGAYLMQAMWR